MLSFTKLTRTFPSARIPSFSEGLPVEVSLIAQLGHGAGDHLFESVFARLRTHRDFIDELDEPSAKLGGTDLNKGDATSLYTFLVGPQGHPFHRHAGHRVFTAVSGSGGAQLRFSSASPEQIASDPQNFIKALRYINIPADCLFTVRFGGETWHQFAPLANGKLHPAFFALSCHTNELGGDLSEELQQQVIANQATIPSLTMLLPQNVIDSLKQTPLRSLQIPSVTLALDASPGTINAFVCKVVRCTTGLLRGGWGRWRGSTGYQSDTTFAVDELKNELPGSLLGTQLAGQFHHDDTFSLTLDYADLRNQTAASLLEGLLDGFMMNRPTGVTRLMLLRNTLVKPMGLRTSPLGCPVSSLLSPQVDNLFAHRFPVLDQRVEHGRAQVILGANDKHLQFRSCVGVEILGDHKVRLTLGTRVRCRNPFGHFYMAMIQRVHRGYISPVMLRMATEYLCETRQLLARPGLAIQASALQPS